MLPEAYANIGLALAAYKQIADSFQQEIEVFANFPSNYLGLINEDESIEFTDGALRLIDPEATSSKTASPRNTSPRSSAKPSSPTATPSSPTTSRSAIPRAAIASARWPGSTSSSPWARRKADNELAEFKQLASGPVESSFHYHHARLIEMLYGIEKIEQILADPQILDKHVRATAGVNRLEGAGQAEAPRGTLIHHYKVDENGLITWANLVIATGQNNNAMNKGVLQAAKAYVKDGKFTEGALNRVEAVIRTFDPCLSCSTHAFGQMPLAMTLLSADGEVVDQVIR